MTLLIEELDKVIQDLKTHNNKLQEENTKLKEGVEKMFQELGAKWHDNEVTIKNPTLFFNSWKEQLLNESK